MIKVIPLRRGRPASLGMLGLLSGLLRKYHAYVEASQVRRYRRAELRRLLRAGPHLIADIGLDYDDALAECRKAPWQD
jgi:uncharacterized protein YjiS (DUF1127 family)